jgi:hypothetical protein
MQIKNKLTGNRPEHLDLVGLVQGVRKPVRVHDVGVQPFRFKPHDVGTIGKTFHLHLQRRAIPGTDALAHIAACE